MRQQNRNKRKAIAGVLALQLVLQSAAVSVNAFAEEETETADVTSSTSDPIVIVQDTPEEEGAEEDEEDPAETTGAPESAEATTPFLTDSPVVIVADEPVTETESAPAENADPSADPVVTVNTQEPASEAEDDEALVTSAPIVTVSKAVDAQISEAEAKSGETITDVITLTDATEIPSRLEQGGKVGIKGTVTSAESALSSVSVVVYDQAFKPITGGAAKPGTKSYDLSRLDSYTAFDQLTAGTYYFRVLVTNDTLTDYIAQESKFVVGTEGGNEKLTDSLEVVGGTEVPASIAQGSSVPVKGIVTSGVSPIIRLSCGIYDQNGGYLAGKTVTPQMQSYDLERLASYVTFSTLPAGTYTYAVIATNSVHTDQTLVRKTFTVESSESVEDKLTLTDAPEIPEQFEPGESVSVSGIVTSEESDMTLLAVGVYNSDRKFVTGKVLAPNAKSYDISALDEYIAFDSLEEGSYMFAVIATNATFTNKALLTRRFVVGDPETAKNPAGADTTAAQTDDALTLTDGTVVPDTLEPGETFGVTGTVTSAASAITSLTVGVYDADAQFVTGKTVTPETESVDLSELDAFVEFDSLDEGTYTYAVIASNAANTNSKLYAKKFTIGSGESVSDEIAISGSNDVPAAIEPGTALNVTGTVTSASSDLTAVTVGVYGADGKFVTGKSINPKTASFDLSALDRFVEFDRLPAGEYRFAVIASNAALENKTLVNKAFKVSGETVKATNGSTDVLTITGASGIPSALELGAGLSVTGIVNSLTSDLTALTAGVYDANGNFVTGKTINPSAKSYDIAKLDAYIAFDQLPAGKYTYAVIASNAENTNTTLQSKKFTVGNAETSAPASADGITIDGGTSLSASVALGGAVDVTGTVQSASSNLSAVSAGVYNAKGKLVTGKTVYPDAKSYDLSALDEDIRFDQLKAGNYSFRVIASNGSNSSITVANQTFTVK